MKREGLYKIALMLCLFMLSGCSLLNQGNSVKAPEKVFSGTDSLSLSIAEAPLSKPFLSPKEGVVPVQFALSLQNKGASDIEEGYVTMNSIEGKLDIKGWTAQLGEVTPIGSEGRKFSFKLKGKSQEAPQGETTVARASIDLLPLQEGRQEDTSEIWITSCYDYRTTAVADVCIDNDIDNTKNIKKTCSLEDISLSSGQGAPIAVTEIRQQIRYDTEAKLVIPSYMITVKNSGRGDVFLPYEAESACGGTAKESRISLENVDLSGMQLGGPIECPRTIELKEGIATFVCDVMPDRVSEYFRNNVLSIDTPTHPATLKITMVYGYKISASTSVTIKASPE